MATTSQPLSRAALPGRDIRPFPSRNPSYRALSIIDAYSNDIQPLPQLQEIGENEKVAVIVRRSAQGTKRRNTNPIEESYENSFDVDEAYGTGDAELNEDDMDDIINLDDYDPYRSNSPPPPRSSSKLPPPVGLKFETKVQVYEVKPVPPPKSQSKTQAKAQDGDYDPYKAASPPKRNPAQLEVRELASRSEPLLAIFNKGATSPAVPAKDLPKMPVSGSLLPSTKSVTNLIIVGTPRSANADKALPTVPSVPRKLLSSPLQKIVPKEGKALPTPGEQQQKAKTLPTVPSRPDENMRGSKDTRKDSLIQSDKESSSATSSPRTRRSPIITEGQWMTPKSSFEQEGAIRVPTGIKRTSKPASLNLTRSNGSTAASGDGAVVDIARPAAAQLPTKKLSPVRQALAETDKSAPLAPSQIAPTHVAPDAATASGIKHANPIEVSYRRSISEQRPVISENSHIATAADDNETAVADSNDPDMQRIKNLVKRKPVGGSTSSTSSSIFSKENSHPRRPESPTKAAASGSAQSQVYSSHKSSHSGSRYTHARQKSHGYDAAPHSPVRDPSLEAFPALESQPSSNTTILAPRAEGARPTTPPVLRSPTPLSQLEESPSKYGLKKKSEANLKSVAEERQSQMFGQSSNGVLRFLSAQKALLDSFTEDAPRSPIFDANTVITNESNRKSYYHASLLSYIKERPRNSNAPKLGTTQLHCHNDHNQKWFNTDNTVHPVNCSLCDVEGGSRSTCSSCGLRVCQDCCSTIKERVENTEFAILLKEAKEETDRLRAEYFARRARSNTLRTVTPSRPGSPVIYPPSDSESPYTNHDAAASTQSLPGIMRPRSRNAEPRRQMYPPSAYNRIPYGRPPGHRTRTSISSLPARDMPPTPRIPDQYLSEHSARGPMTMGSRASEMELRGRHGHNPDSGQHGGSRHASPMRGYDGRGKSRPRPSRGLEIDPMAELRRPAEGLYGAIPRSTGARTPGSMR